MSEKITFRNQSNNNKRLLIVLVSCIVTFTLFYQLRPFLEFEEFAWIAVPAFTFLPAILLGYVIVTTIKLFKQKHLQAKSFLLFTFGIASWFIAEQIWIAYDYFWEGDPFPSEADFFLYCCISFNDCISILFSKANFQIN